MAKSDQTPAQTRRSVEEEVREAERRLDEAREHLAEAQGDLRAVVTRDVPQMVVEVMPNAHIVHEGKGYYGAEYGFAPEGNFAKDDERMLHGKDHGPQLTLDGPTAIALVMEGAVKIVRSA